MKRSLCFSFVVAILFALTLSAFAQTPATAPARDPKFDYQTVVGPADYNVVSGDTVWGLNPTQWTKLRNNNEWMAYGQRDFTTPEGGPGINIYPWDIINVPAGMTITMMRPKAPVVTTGQTADQTGNPNPAPPVDTKAASFPWLWVIIGAILVLAAGLAYYFWSRRQRQQEQAVLETERLREINERQRQLALDPVTSGAPIIEGGVPQGASDEVMRDIVREVAAARLSRHIGINVSARGFTIESALTRVYLNGVDYVNYADRQPELRTFNNTPAWQAMVRFGNNAPELLTFLEGCGNDIGRRGDYSRFTITLDPLTQPIPATDPPPQIRPAAVAAGATVPMVTLTVEGVRYSALASSNLSCDFEGGKARVTANGQITAQRIAKATRPREIRTLVTATGTTKQQ